MEKPTHVELFSCFTVGWGLFMLTEMARMGAEAKPSCDHFDDKIYKGKLAKFGDALEANCNGLAAGTVFSTIALLFAIASLVVRSDVTKRASAFLASVVFWLIAVTSATGGNSSGSCEVDGDSPGCQGYGAAATFYMFAAVAAAGTLVVTFKFPENKTLFCSLAAAMLGLYSLAELSEYATMADSYCGDTDKDDDNVADKAEAYCSGNAFASLVLSFSMAMMFAFAAFVHVKGDTTKATVVWYLWAALFLLARVASTGASAKDSCDINDKGKAAENACNGYGFSAFFYMVAFLVAVAGIYVNLKSMEKVGNLVFYAVFGLFYLAYTCSMGGMSAAACENDDNPPKGATKLEKDQFESLCGGYGFGTFSSLMAAIALIGAAVLSQTARVERSDNADTTADAVSAVPVEAYTLEDNSKGAVHPEQQKQQQQKQQQQQQQDAEGANV